MNTKAAPHPCWQALTGASPRQQTPAAAPAKQVSAVEASGATQKLQSTHPKATSFDQAFSALRGCNSIVLFNTRDDPCCQMMHTLLSNVIGDGNLSEVEVEAPFQMLKQPLAQGLQAEFPEWLSTELSRSTGCGAPFVYVNNNFYGDTPLTIYTARGPSVLCECDCLECDCLECDCLESYCLESYCLRM